TTSSSPRSRGWDMFVKAGERGLKARAEDEQAAHRRYGHNPPESSGPDGVDVYGQGSIGLFPFCLVVQPGWPLLPHTWHRLSLRHSKNLPQARYGASRLPSAPLLGLVTRQPGSHLPCFTKSPTDVQIWPSWLSGDDGRPR